MLPSNHIEEEWSQKQIGAILKITDETLNILRNLQQELNNYQLLSFGYLMRLTNIQISDLQNKQKKYNLFLNEDEKRNSHMLRIQSNELFQLNISIRLQLKGELQKCEKDINKDFLNKLLQELNKSDELFGKEEKKYQYRKLFQFKTKNSNFCQRYAFNTSSSVVFTGYDEGSIKVHGFNSIYKLLSAFSNKMCDGELAWIKQSNSLVECVGELVAMRHHYWNSYQQLEHTNKVSCLILNQKEDLLISAGYDNTLSFWKNVNSVWTLEQTIEVQFNMSCLSLNTSEKQLISCGYQSDIVILELLSNQQWVITQQIPVEKHGLYLGFVNDNQFIFQPLAQQFLEIYNFQEDERKFVKVKTIQFICGPNQQSSFKFKIIREKNLIVVKHHWYIILIKYNQNWDHSIQQVMNFHSFYIWGNITENGQFLVTWDSSINRVWMLKCLT